MKTIELIFEHEKETKNTHRYKEVVPGDNKPVVDSLYVSKEAAGDCKRLKVTIEKDD